MPEGPQQATQLRLGGVGGLLAEGQVGIGATTRLGDETAWPTRLLPRRPERNDVHRHGRGQELADSIGIGALLRVHPLRRCGRGIVEAHGHTHDDDQPQPSANEARNSTRGAIPEPVATQELPPPGSFQRSLLQRPTTKRFAVLLAAEARLHIELPHFAADDGEGRKAASIQAAPLAAPPLVVAELLPIGLVPLGRRAARQGHRCMHREGGVQAEQHLHLGWLR